jgi:hypothetical protein
MVKHESGTLSTSRDSPASSHSVKRHTKNKKSDPFLELSNDFNTAEQPNPRSPKDEETDVDRGNSFFADVRDFRLCRLECVADSGSLCSRLSTW